MEIWIIADTHFSHERIIEYENRPFQNTAEMNEVLVDNWNKTVKANDIVWHLGDFAMGDKTHIQDLFDRLAGKKHLILGNHDKMGRGKWRDLGFKRVEKTYRLDPLELTHYPLDENKVIEMKAKEAILGNVHGHVHSKNKHLNPAHYFCASVELIDYRPIHVDEVLKHFKEKKEGTEIG